MKCGTQLMVGELGVSSYVASGRINVPGRGEDGSGNSDGSGSYIHRISIYMFRSIQRSDILVFSFWRGLFLIIYKSPKRKHKFLSLHWMIVIRTPNIIDNKIQIGRQCERVKVTGLKLENH
jgi:hypothetical protein